MPASQSSTVTKSEPLTVEARFQAGANVRIPENVVGSKYQAVPAHPRNFAVIMFSVIIIYYALIIRKKNLLYVKTFLISKLMLSTACVGRENLASDKRNRKQNCCACSCNNNLRKHIKAVVND